MTDRINNDLAALLTPPPSKGVQFSQAVVLSWDNETLHNTLEWRGITLTDIPIVEGINALTIRPGDVVGLLGWAPENAKGVGSWWILGKLSNPGETVADLIITAKLIRFVTEAGNPLVFFGKEVDGDPMWALYYGDSQDTAAVRIVNGNDLYVNYRNGAAAVRITGTEGEQIIRVFDQVGNEVFSTNGATGGRGIADPAFAYTLYPGAGAEQIGTSLTPGTTSASFVDLWRCVTPVYHPVIAYGFSVIASGVTEWRIRMSDLSGTLVNVATGSGAMAGTFDVPDFIAKADTGNLGATDEIVIQARNTGGGSTQIRVDRFYGRQS